MRSLLVVLLLLCLAGCDCDTVSTQHATESGDTDWMMYYSLQQAGLDPMSAYLLSN